MDAASEGLAQEEDGEEGIDEQDIVDCMVLCLAALTCGLCRRVLGADNTPFRSVMGTRGDAGTTAGELLRQGRDHRGRIGLRDAEPLRQGRQRAGRSITEGAGRVPLRCG